MTKEKLKTVKDLYEKADLCYASGLDECEYGCAEAIKAEAIKWVKWKLSKSPNLEITKITWSDGQPNIYWKGEKDLFTAGFCNALIDFHNLTLKELKNE